jgi:hypothetical protein
MRIIVFLSPMASYALLQIKPLFFLMISVVRYGGKLVSEKPTIQHRTKRIASVSARKTTP